MGDPKTQASQRRIMLSADTVQVLKNHLALQEQEEKHWKALKSQEEGLVFPSARGGFQLPSNLIKVFHKIIQLAGVPSTTCGTLQLLCWYNRRFPSKWGLKGWGTRMPA